MTVSDINQINFAYYMVIILCVLQFITFVALFIFWVAFKELKKNIHRYKDSLPLVNIKSSSSQPAITPPVSKEPPSIAVGNLQKPEFNEVIERLPTPNPNRKSFVNSIAIETKPIKESAEKNPEFSSFSPFKRDSGIGSSSVRNQSTSSNSNAVFQEKVSVHEESRSTSNASNASRDTTVFQEGADLSYTNPDFQENVSVLEESRTTSNASSSSRGPIPFKNRALSDSYQVASKKTPQNMRTTSYSSYGRKTLQDYRIGLNDDDEDDGGGRRYFSRLQTMYIEDIDLTTTSPNEKRYKRASQSLNENISYVNRGYSDASESAQRRAPLASEECSLSSDVHNMDENANEVQEELYENQEIINKHRISMNLESTNM